jgi:hypothetical protein
MRRSSCPQIQKQLLNVSPYSSIIAKIMFTTFSRFLQLSLSSFFLWAISCALPATAQSAPNTAKPLPPSSYLGLGGAIGLNGNTSSLSSGGLAILSKVGFTDNLSLHDATILFGNGAATSMIILTAEFPIRNSTGQTVVSPFIGGGTMLRYNQGLLISPALSGGIDIPLSKNFTGTVRLNAGFPSDRPADLGILIGAGYNIGS